jgi:hypothetical protein
MDPRVKKVVAKFARSHWDLKRADRAEDECFITSVEFQEALDDAGLLASCARGLVWDVVRVYTCKLYHMTAVNHWVFRYGEDLIDFTAAQFDDTLPFPLVMSVDDAVWDSGE